MLFWAPLKYWISSYHWAQALEPLFFSPSEFPWQHCCSLDSVPLKHEVSQKQAVSGMEGQEWYLADTFLRPESRVCSRITTEEKQLHLTGPCMVQAMASLLGPFLRTPGRDSLKIAEA